MKSNSMAAAAFGAGAVILLAAGYYYLQLAKRDFLGSELAYAVEGFTRAYEHDKTPNGRNRLATAYAPVFLSLPVEIDSLAGYWKSLHKVYHYMARAALAEGRTGDTLRYLRKSINVHPYYANAIRMMGNMWLILGRRNAGAACSQVDQSIMKGENVEPETYNLCLAGVAG